jgi:hypothetical protein
MIFDTMDNETTSQSGRSFPGTRESRALYAANGFIELGERQTYKSRQPRFDSWQTSRLVKIESLSGQIFPLKVGNQFSYSAVYEEESHNSPEQRILRQSCKIARKQEARDFHYSLGGDAYVADCESTVTYQKLRTPGRTKTREVFIETLGLWVTPYWQTGATGATSKLRSLTLAK